jgi:hypothetical protein
VRLLFVLRAKPQVMEILKSAVTGWRWFERECQGLQARIVIPAAPGAVRVLRNVIPYRANAAMLEGHRNIQY